MIGWTSLGFNFWECLRTRLIAGWNFRIAGVPYSPDRPLPPAYVIRSRPGSTELPTAPSTRRSRLYAGLEPAWRPIAACRSAIPSFGWRLCG